MAGTSHVISSAFVAAALFAGLTAGAHAAPQDDLQRAVTRLGELNGIALACKQGALAARLRGILIDVAPKERLVGHYFEEATSKAFLQAGQSVDECPDGRTLAGRIDVAHEALRLAVAEKP